MATSIERWALLAALLAALVFPGTAAAVDIIPLEEVKPGMKGYGLTVFSGIEPERFGVEVISVVPDFLLRQSIILIRCNHPVTDRAGVIGGMSGSPIYLDGRLAGALAYGWRFSTEPVAGVTPIANMRAVLDRKQRQPQGAPGGKVARLGTLFPSGGGLTAHPGVEFFERFARPEAEELVPARTPLMVGGFVDSARGMLGEILALFGIEPVAGGGASGKSDGPRPAGLVPGGSIGVQLIRGDMNATAIGTVTDVAGKSVLAFGHPMFNMGEGYLPVTTARIHAVIASLMRSNKMGSPLDVAGSLIQDRNACIVADTERRAAMIPVDIRVRDARSRREDTYSMEVASQRYLTPQFIKAALVNVIFDAASDLEDVTAEMTGVIRVRGRPPVTLHDSGLSRTGLVSLTGYFRPVAVVDAVLNNPFEDAAIESVRFDIDLRYGLDVARIVGAYLTAEKPLPGDVVSLHVLLKRYDEADDIVSIPIEIPWNAAGQKIQVEVAGGDFITPPIPAPQSLDDILTNVGRLYPPKSIVVGVNVAGEGVSLRGRLLERLPPSTVDALSPAAGTDQVYAYRTALRRVQPTGYLVQGKETISVTVGERRPR